MPPLTRVKRSRMAFALATTLAALPILVLDNLPATAETGRTHVESSATVGFEPPSTTATTVVSSTTAAPTTTTTAAPATTEPVAIAAVQAPAPTTTAPPTTTTTLAPTTTRPSSGYADPNDPASWEALAQCESGANWTMNAGNGYYGGLQFSLASWQNVGGAGYPHQASEAEQINRGKILQARYGWDQWPYCASRLGFI